MFTGFSRGVPVMTADERLALVRLKIERADKHIIDLQTSLNTFRAANPYEIGTKRNPETRQLDYYLVRIDPIPNTIRATVGDILNSLRSTLDHLAQQLYLAGSGASEYRDQTGFPLSPSANDFKPKFVAKKTEGMRQDAVDAIRALEPYAGGKGSDLWTLDRLNNIDKHRLIAAVWSILDGVGPQSMVQRLPPYFAQFESLFKQMTDSFFIRPADRSPLKAGDILFTDAPDAEPNENQKFCFQVAFHEPGICEGKPVLETLMQFRDRVNGILEAFRPCLA
jgi:hypothetical protein